MNNEDNIIDELFEKPKAVKDKAPKITLISIDKLSPFPEHPFRVIDDEEMDSLVESIRENGIMSPLIVRLKSDSKNEYEVISGHRRLHAAQKAGFKTVPAMISPLDRDSAVITLVDSNLHREHLLPSEKAFAYKLKMKAMSHQGKKENSTSTQVVEKLSVEQICEAADESRETVRRYIRLTNLVPELLEMVDTSKIAFTPAVEISYLTETEQYKLLATIEIEECMPSLSQAQELKMLSCLSTFNLSDDEILRIMTSPKPNQKEKLKIPMERIRSFFPKEYTAKQIEDEVVKLCEERFKKRQRSRDTR